MIRMHKIRCFPEKNYKAIWYKGKTIRIALDPSKPILELDYPEFWDIAITNQCDGNCPYCYQFSTPTTKHYGNIVGKIKYFFGKMNENQRPFQIACLEESTPIFTTEGMKEIKDLKIGDFIIDEKGKFVKIKNIVKRKRNIIELIGNKGVNIKCTKDHIFYSNGKPIEAKDCLNRQLDLALFNKNDFIDKIDLSGFINKSSKIPHKRGGSPGGKIIGDKVRIMHRLPFIDKYINLNEDIMWLYGLTVAEGSKRGLSLHKSEIDFANRAKKIYSTITKFYNTNIARKKNCCIVEFEKSKIYRIIFMDAMGIGYGARNKSIKFLYNVNNNLLRSALRGMFDGDGCYRKRKKFNGFALSYKTTSKKMAYELAHLLQSRFGISVSLYHGFSPKRMIEGRILKKSDYYMVDITNKDDILKLFPDIFSKDKNFKKISLKHSVLCKKAIVIKKIKKYKNPVNVYDIVLDDNSSHLFTLTHGIITHNCGGGEPTLHPNFIDLIHATDDLGIVPNYTTNGLHLTEDILRVTETHCGAVAVTTHEHLNWKRGADALWQSGIKTNLHILIHDKASIDRFIKICEKWIGCISYFVLLPMINQGRANGFQIDNDYLFEKINEFEKEYPRIKDCLAFGAKFYEELKKRDLKMSLYEPEIMSKYLVLSDDMPVYPSSFSLEKK